MPRHFDRSCSQHHREQRSGEICFSTHTFTWPKPHLLLFLPSNPALERSFPFSRLYLFFPVFTDTTFTGGTTIGRRIGTSPAPGCCCCCIRASISVRT
jgi:hypothetical protein